MSDNSSEELVCEESAPSFIDYMPALSLDYLIAFGVLTFITCILFFNYVEELHFLYKYSSRWQSRDKAKWLLALYPVTAFTALVSLLAPKASGLNDVVAASFVSLCVYIFVVMLVQQYGGPERMLLKLKNRPLRLNPFPFCCLFCFGCAPCSRVRRTTLQVLHAMIMQFTIIRPFLGYIISVMWADASYGHTNNAITSPQTYISFVYLLSTLTAVYAFAIVFDQSREYLENMHIRPKFICLQSVLLISGAQRGIISIVFMVGGWGCDPPLHVEAVIDRWNHMLQIGEMLVLAIIARIFYRQTVQARLGQLAKTGDDVRESVLAIGLHNIVSV